MDKKLLSKEIFIRAKNVVIMLLIPLFFTFVFGVLYSKIYVEEIPMAILDLDHSNLSRTLIKEFDNSPGFHVTYYAQSESELEEIIKKKNVRAGLIIPKNFNQDVREMKAPKTCF